MAEMMNQSVIWALRHFAVTWAIIFFSLQISGLCSEEKGNLAALPSLEDNGDGLLFHASFDRDCRADFAIGSDLPSMADYPFRCDNTETAGKRIPGIFGQAYIGVSKPIPGCYDALGNFLPARGTVAFHIQVKEKPIRLEWFHVRVTGYYNYYWNMYIRFLGNTVWFANEIYRPIVLAPKKDISWQDGKWHHIAITWDQAYGANLYIDARKVASNWKEVSWHSRGVDPDFFLFNNNDQVAYDEFYVFDRPLTDDQIAKLAKNNIAPRKDELASVPFDTDHQLNRLKELSWEYPDPMMLKIRLGMNTGDVFTIRQVVPSTVQAVKKKIGEATDGLLGTGWPTAFTYEFNNGNGLHVELGESYDYMTIEGYFQGAVYGEHQLEAKGAKPIQYVRSKEFMYRQRFDSPGLPGWLSFFKGEMEDKGDLPDKELVTRSRICEISFFHVGSGNLTNALPLRYYLGPASLSEGPTALGVELSGRYEPGDRSTLSLSRNTPEKIGGQSVSKLRYHHLIVPPMTYDTPLKGIRLAMWLRGALPSNLLRVELHDSILPARRICVLDFELDGLDDKEPRLFNLNIDLSDRIVPRGKPVWLTFCFKHEVDLLWLAGEKSSFLELMTGPVKESLPEFCRTEEAFVRSLFSGLSESRPWGRYEEPEKELADHNKLARQLFDPLVFLRKIDPNNRKVQGLWRWTHKDIEDTSLVNPLPVRGCENAPRWALLQRELLQRSRDVLYWWIDNRQAPNGEFGDDWADDTDLCNENFPKLILLGDPDNRLRDAIKKVADGVYTAGRIKRGINAGIGGDPLHAYEEGVNVTCAMSLADYGNPKYLERLMESAKTVDEYLTTKDVKGRRRFRSSAFGAMGIRDQGQEGYDSTGNALFCHPALSLAYYNRNPRCVRFLQEWVDGWIDIYMENAKPKEQKYPRGTLLDGTVVWWDTKVRGFGYVDLYAALYAMTKEQRYRDTARYWTGEAGPAGTRAFMRGDDDYRPALELIDRDKYRQELISWAEEANLRCPFADSIGSKAVDRYIKWEVTGDEQAAYDALEACLRKIRSLYDIYTWAEPIADRVTTPDFPLIVMTQGGMSYARNWLWPNHYVSYQGFSDFAAWVREKSDPGLKIWIYNFAPREEKGILRVWRTPLGEYELHLGEDKNKDGVPDDGEKRFLVLHPSAAIPLVVPSRRLCALSLRLLKKSDEDFWQRPDLGISSEDVQWQKDNKIAITVHNLGSSTATNVLIRILDEKQKKVAEKTLSLIEAPLDLNPRKTEVTFDGITNDSVFVKLDPDGKIAELNEENNNIQSH